MMYTATCGNHHGVPPWDFQAARVPHRFRFDSEDVEIDDEIVLGKRPRIVSQAFELLAEPLCRFVQGRTEATQTAEEGRTLVRYLLGTGICYPCH